MDGWLSLLQLDPETTYFKSSDLDSMRNSVVLFQLTIELLNWLCFSINFFQALATESVNLLPKKLAVPHDAVIKAGIMQNGLIPQGNVSHLLILTIRMTGEQDETIPIRTHFETVPFEAAGFGSVRSICIC